VLNYSIKHHAMKLHHSWSQHWTEVSGQLHAPVALLHSRGKSLRYALDRRLDGLCREEKNLFLLPGIEPQFLYRPAHGLSLYRLSYTTHVRLHAKCPLQLSDFNQNWMCPRILIKLPYIKFHKNRFSGSRVVSSVQTDKSTGWAI
jgi:hypothetical protein